MSVCLSVCLCVLESVCLFEELRKQTEADGRKLRKRMRKLIRERKRKRESESDRQAAQTLSERAVNVVV